MVTPYQLFYESLKTEATKRVYRIHIEKFFEYTQTDYDKLVKLPKDEISELVYNYVIHLKDLTAKTQVPSPNSYGNYLSPIQTFLEQNDILLNWKKIKRLCPKKIPTANQLPYTDKDVRELLESTTSIRNKAFIHFMASSGVRVGAIPTLQIQDVKPIEDGAIVTIYRNSTEEYRTCLTPEAYGYLKKYLSQRLDKDDESVLFTRKDNLTPLNETSAKDVIRHVRKQAKLSVDHGRKSTRGKSQNHAFRKRFEICLASSDLQSKFIEYLMGHFTAQDRYYFRGVSDESLYVQFKRAIPALTIDKSKKIEEEKNEEIRILQETSAQDIKEKLEAQDEMIQNMMLEMASAKYFAYETRYAKCFGGKNPDLKKLSKLMSNEEIKDWNRIIPIVQREKDWTISLGTKSEEMLRDTREKREIKDLIKKLKKQGKTSEMIEQLEKMLEEF